MAAKAYHVRKMLEDLTLDEVAQLVEKLQNENKQYQEQTDIERNFYQLYIKLYTAWTEAKNNEECAHILRVFLTDVEKFMEEFPHGERSYRRGSKAYKLWKKKIKSDKEAARANKEMEGTTPKTD